MVMDLKGVNVVKVEVEEVGETEVEIKEKVVERYYTHALLTSQDVFATPYSQAFHHKSHQFLL